MFTTEMRERTQEKIKIENISHAIFILVLKYLYTDECDITLEVFIISTLKRYLEFNGAF